MKLMSKRKQPDLEIRIIVPAVPVAQPRQRHAIRGNGSKAFVSNYTPSKHPVQAFKATVRMASREVYAGPPLEGPLRVDCVFVLPRPLNKRWKTRAMPRYHHTGRKDLDNLAKSIYDALTGTLWFDDGQIAKANCVKVVASGDEQPHVEITVFRLDESVGGNAGECPPQPEPMGKAREPKP